MVVITEVKLFLRNLENTLNQKESFTLKEDHRITVLGPLIVLFVKSLATGRHSVLCGPKLKLSLSS